MEYYKRFEPAAEYWTQAKMDAPERGEAFRKWCLPTSFNIIGDPITRGIGARYLIPAEPTPMLIIPALRFSTTESGRGVSDPFEITFADVYLATRFAQTLPFLAECSEQWAYNLWKRSRHYFEDDDAYSEVWWEADRAANTITACGLDVCVLPMTSYVVLPEIFLTDVYPEIEPKLPVPKLRRRELIYPILSLFYRQWKEEPFSSFFGWATELQDNRFSDFGEDRLRQILTDAGIYTPCPRPKKTNPKKHERPRDTT